jgi:hypothetical protein
MSEARAFLRGSSQSFPSDVAEHTEFGWAWGVEVESNRICFTPSTLRVAAASGAAMSYR